MTPRPRARRATGCSAAGSRAGPGRPVGRRGSGVRWSFGPPNPGDGPRRGTGTGDGPRCPGHVLKPGVRPVGDGGDDMAGAPGTGSPSRQEGPALRGGAGSGAQAGPAAGSTEGSGTSLVDYPHPPPVPVCATCATSGGRSPWKRSTMEKVSGSDRHIWHIWYTSLPGDPGIRFNASPESNSAPESGEFLPDLESIDPAQSGRPAAARSAGVNTSLLKFCRYYLSSREVRTACIHNGYG